MRTSLFAAAFVVVLAPLLGTEAKAAAFCASGPEGLEVCSYYTLAQCRASVSGVGGFCMLNPQDAAAAWARMARQ
jgi:hypothetical protein